MLRVMTPRPNPHVRVVSVDLAYVRSEDVGIVLLERSARGVRAERVQASAIGIGDRPAAAVMAAALAGFCRAEGAEVLLIDGPQAWKDPGNGLEHSRRCERQLHTPGKTGTPGRAKPGSYLGFIDFSIAVFDALHAHGFGLYTGRREGPVVIECFPTSAWRQLRLPPLPGKSRCTPDEVLLATDSLRELFAVDVRGTLTHDEVQALVAAFAGLALATGSDAGFTSAGCAPVRIDETWREGFIVNPTREALHA